MATKQSLSSRSWSKDNIQISTDVSLISTSQVNEVFASSEVYWAKPLPEELVREMLNNSLCFGLYEEAQDTSIEQDKKSTKQFIGFSRLVTDFVTFAYLTDVWISPAHQGKGLGKWLVQCVREVIDDMPGLRRLLLMTGDWKRSVPFYQRELASSLMQSKEGGDLAVLETKGRGHPSYMKEGSSYT